MHPSATLPVDRRRFLQTAGVGTALLGTTPLGGRAQQPSSPADLPRRELGKTGVSVPILGVGTAPAGQRSRSEAAELFSECLDRGANYMDTAPDFAGYGVAQVALGDVLKSRRREAFVVTKCWKADGEEALALLRQNLHELQTDYADVVYAHSIGSDEMDLKTVLGPRGVMKALEKAQRDGLVRHIGISGHNRPAKFLEVMKHCDVQVMMNAVSFVSRHIYDFEQQVWPAAREKNIGLVAMKVFGGMQGGGKGGRLRGEEAHLAFRYAQSLPGVSTAVVGIYDRDELETNLQWTRQFQPLSDEEFNTLSARGTALAQQWGEVYGPK